MSEERAPVNIPFEDAQRIFDIAVAMDTACSGFMDSEDVTAMRKLAVLLGVDPKVCTPSEYMHLYPHAFVASPPQRRQVIEHRADTGSAWNIRTARPETDEEMSARGATTEDRCAADRWSRCGKPASDPIHNV